MKILSLNSNICLSPNQCYDIKTEIPIWLIAVLIGSSYLIIKEIYNNI